MTIRSSTLGLQHDVERFHAATNGTIGLMPGLRDEALRASLIAEEAAETIAALGFDVKIRVDRAHAVAGPYLYHTKKSADYDLAKAMDGVIDSMYVLIGTAVAAGVDLSPLWAAVHKANMTKVGGPQRADGKQLKPKDWQPADIEGLINQQRFIPETGGEG